MPRDITGELPPEHLIMGLYDSQPREVSVVVIADRVVDITDICFGRGSEQVVIKYGQNREGPVAQLQHRTEPHTNPNTEMQLLPDGAGSFGLRVGDSFETRARAFGCQANILARVVLEFTPPKYKM